MFQLVQDTTVTLSHINVRTEKHGPADVDAFDLDFALTGENRKLLALLHPRLCESLFFNAEREAGQEVAEGVDDSVPNLRFTRLADALPWSDELHNLAWALSLPGFDRMATDEQETEHQVGVQRVNDMLQRMERAKAEHDAAMADAARFRWLDEVALSVDMVADPDNLVRVWHSYVNPDGRPTTGRTLREAVDEAMKRHNV